MEKQEAGRLSGRDGEMGGGAGKHYAANNLQEPADINWGFMANMFLAAKIYD